MNNLINYIIILTAVLLIVLAAVLIIRVIYKKKLNKRLAMDRETLASGGIPSGTERHGMPGFGVLSLSLAIIAFTFSLLAFGLSQTRRLENQIRSSENNTGNALDQILSELEEIRIEQKKAQSILSSVSVQTQKDSWDEEKMTVRCRVVIVPKEIFVDTEVTLTVDGTEYKTVREGSGFSALVETALLTEKSDLDCVYISVSSNGVSKIEAVNDTLIFPKIANLFFPDRNSYLPSVNGWYSVAGHPNYEPEVKKGAFSIDHKVNLELSGGIYGVSKCSVRLYDGSRLLLEQDLTDRLPDGNENSAFTLRDIGIKGSWKNIVSDHVELVISATDSKGYTFSVYERFFAENTEGSLSPHDEILTAPDGTVLYRPY